MQEKRKIKIAVISDVHLGTYGCHAKELLKYLKSIEPEILILNGDIIDIWQFRKSYFPQDHMKVIKEVTSFISKGTMVYYLTGNHDEMLRRFTDFELNNFKLLDKLVLEIDNKKAWFFHGDVFDVTMKHSKWLAKLGAVGYDVLIVLNRLVNFISETLGRGKLSISKKIKEGVKGAIKFIDDFEQTVVDLAIEKQYDYVVCGLIHQPQIKNKITEKGSVQYLNSGDWVENLTALEYNSGEWSMYHYSEAEFQNPNMDYNHLEENKIHSKMEAKQNELLEVLFQSMTKKTI